MYKVLVLPDLHIPKHDRKTLKAVLRYARDFAPQEIIQLGDFMDFDCISRHSSGKPRVLETQRLKKDLAQGNQVLDQLQSITPKVTLIEGNHDERIERWLDEFPVVEGVFELETSLKLKERGIKWVRFARNGEVYRIGKASFGHGLYTNEHHAKSHGLAFGGNFFYGHLHDVQSHSKVLIGDNSTTISQSLGCLCSYKQYYMKGRPNRWQQAFGVFYFQPSGKFNHYVVNIFNHRFVSPGGVVYDGN